MLSLILDLLLSDVNKTPKGRKLKRKSFNFNKTPHDQNVFLNASQLKPY